MKKLLILVIALMAIVSCLGVVSADSADDTVMMGPILSSDFTATDNSDFLSGLFGGGNQNITYNYTVSIDTTNIDEDYEKSTEFFADYMQAEDSFDFTVSDGKNQYEFTDVPCDMYLDEGNLTISSEGITETLNGTSLDLANCEITHCSIHFTTNGITRTYETQ